MPVDFQPVVDFEPIKSVSFEPVTLAPASAEAVQFETSLLPPPPAQSSEELAARNFYNQVDATGQIPTRPHSSFFQNATEPLAHPATPLTGPTVQQALNVGPKTAAVIAGVQSSVAEAVNSLTSPLGIATLGVGALPRMAQRIVAGLFATHMATKLPGQTVTLVEAIKEGDPEKIAKAGTDVGLGATLTGVAGRHAIRGPQPLPPSAPVGIDVLPDFMHQAEAARMFSQEFGVGRIPFLGPLLDPNARSNTPEQHAISRYHAETKGVGPSIASYIGSRYGPEIRNAFQADNAGDLNVGRTAPTQSLKISDVFEALERDPTAYTLSPEQAGVWQNVIQPILASKRRLVDQYDLAETVDANGNPIAHFHRIVTEFPNEPPTPSGRGQSIGARIPSQRARTFTESEQQGWDHGYRYELDPVRRLVSDVERTYKAIADRRLIDDPVFGGTTPQALEAQLRITYAAELASGQMTQRGFDAMLQNQIARGRVFQPGFNGRIFDPETAQLLNNVMEPGNSRLLRGISNVNDTTKALRLGFDMGVGQIQLLPTFFRNPSVWARANWESLKAFTNPETFTEYLRAHEPAARELAEHGSSIGQLQEYMSGLQSGATLTRIPGVGQVAEAFGRQFQTALDVAKIQLWEAQRIRHPEMTPEQRLSTIRTIESQLGVGRMESIGVGKGQAAVERLTLLASSYYRGAVNYVASIGEPGVSGQVARQGLTAFVGGGLALYYGISKMIGMDDEEIKSRLDPSKPTFMQWTVETDDGKTLNIGLGGVHRSLIKLGGNIVRTTVEHPENWASLSAEKNPISKWLRGHMATAPEMAFTAFSGEDYFGNEATAATVAGSALPLTMQQSIKQDGQPEATAEEYTAAFAGLSTYPESQNKRKQRLVDEAARTAYSKPYDQLSVGEQARVQREVAQDPAFAVKNAAPLRMRELAQKSAFEREKRIHNNLSDDSRKKLETLQIRVRGYNPEMSAGGVSFPMTDKQRDAYEETFTKELDRLIGKLNEGLLMKNRPEQRQIVLDNGIEVARKKAMAAAKRQGGASTPPQP